MAGICCEFGELPEMQEKFKAARYRIYNRQPHPHPQSCYSNVKMSP
jgi:hypothetical protein